MGWDTGYMGDCPNCGYHIHQFAEDRPGKTAIWLQCPKCLRADVEMVDDQDKVTFWDRLHPCSICGTARDPWKDSSCPRCGTKSVGKFYCVPD